MVRLAIYDVQGRLVRILVDDAVDAGYHRVVWDGTDESGNEVGSGMYFYRLNSEGFEQMKKMMLIR